MHVSDSLVILTTRYLLRSRRIFLPYMPESHEAEAHRKMAVKIYNHLKALGIDFHLLGIWADGTEKETDHMQPCLWTIVFGVYGMYSYFVRVALL